MTDHALESLWKQVRALSNLQHLLLLMGFIILIFAIIGHQVIDNPPLSPLSLPSVL